MDLGTNNKVILLIVLVVSIVLHEMMHAYASYWLGDDTAKLDGRTSLNPLRHIDPFFTIILPAITLLFFGFPMLAAKPVPFNPNRVKYEEFGAALIGFAGPLTNLILAILAATVFNLAGGSFGGAGYQFLIAFIEVNVLLFVFNMIPLPPLDGSRVLYAFAPEAVQNVMAQMEQFGIFIIFALIIAVPGFITLLTNVDNAVLRLVLKV